MRSYQDDRQTSETHVKPARKRLTPDVAQILERALAQVESLLEEPEEPEIRTIPAKENGDMASQDVTDLKRVLREVVTRLEDALDHLGLEAQRLSDETSRVSLIAERLEALSRTGATEPEPVVAEPAALEPETVEPEEPQFLPGDHALGLVVAAVPGFQGLMDMQRGLSGLDGVAGASVSGYRDGEATLEIVLTSPVSARELVEGLHQATGHEILIEESRPEAQRLRLRFTNHGARASA